MTRQYAAFISYRHRPLDIAVAEKLHKRIERFKIPKDLRKEEERNPGSVFTNWEEQLPEGNLLVFRDREELPLSNDLTADIFEALDNTKCLIVVCTPDTPKSQWVRREISYFIEKHGRGRIVTVLAAGTPEESIPKEITTEYAEDGVTVLEEHEPLVAYLTADSQRKVLKNLDKELLRLCAAILGCPYDALRQRHKRRKMQQTMAAFAGAFLVALSFIGMLIDRNLEIEAQRRSVQLRESELLTADAEEALASGNTLLAIEKAVSALPKEGEEDRPYYAPAESVLMESMDILGGVDAPVLLKEIQLEQMTPIAHFGLSSDGRLAVTVDDYGVLHCFDTVSGRELWSDIMQSDSLAGERRLVQFSEDDRFLLCSYCDLLECRDPESGRVLWSYKLEYASNGYFVCDHRQNRLAIFRYLQRMDKQAYCLELILLDMETGETLSEMTVEQTGVSMSYSLVKNTSTRVPANAVFSEDGRYLACAFAQKEADKDNRGLVCFVVDLEEACVTAVYRQDLPEDGACYVTAMEMRGEELYIALEPGDDSVAATLIKLDWTCGKQLWCTSTPAELENSKVSLDLTSTTLLWERVAVIGRYEKLYAIDLDSGRILDSVKLPGMLNYLYTVSSRNFAFSLDDGTYAIGWFNGEHKFTLSTDPYFQVSTDMGPHTLLLPYGGGIVQMFTEGTYFELSVSNVERYGYLALVPSKKENVLLIQRPVDVEKPMEQTVISLAEDQQRIYCSDGDPVFCDNGQMILGVFSADQEDHSSKYFYFTIDRNTRQVVQSVEVDLSSNQQYYFLSDGSGYLRYADGTTWLCRNGESVPVAQKKASEIPDGGYYDERFVATDTVRLSGGSLLTAHCDADSMRLLRNGEETANIPLPEGHAFTADPQQFLSRRVLAGKNGGILTSCYSNSASIPSDAFALYWPETGWTGFGEDFALCNASAVAFGEDSRIALADEQNQLRLFRMENGIQIAAFPLQMPSRSVTFMDFILDDSFLLVKTKDAQILIYDLATGEICFHDKMGNSYYSSLRTYSDGENQRLYIVDSSVYARPNCLCVDLRNWTTLGTGSQVLCYDESNGELIHFNSGYDSKNSLSCLKIPTTQDLVLLGQQMMAAQ